LGLQPALNLDAQRQRVLMLARERDKVAVAQHVSIMPVPSLRDSEFNW
jgi:hypothetical protein